jgi:hypothetical protein
MPMFRWPRIVERRGVVTLSARHRTQGSDKAIEICVNTTIVLTMIGTAMLVLRVGQGELAARIVGAVLLGFLALIPGAILAMVLYPVFWLLCWVRTTVRIYPGHVEVAGIRYDRASVPIHFTNLYPQAVQIETFAGRAAFGGLEETTGLRMFYGANAILITTFRSAHRASRFALAANAALDRAATPAIRSVGVVSVQRIYQGDVMDGPRQTQALPSPRNLPVVRRRNRKA